MTAEALGLTWYQTWVSDGEGPSTQAAGLAAANPDTAGRTAPVAPGRVFPFQN